MLSSGQRSAIQCGGWHTGEPQKRELYQAQQLPWNVPWAVQRQVWLLVLRERSGLHAGPYLFRADRDARGLSTSLLGLSIERIR